jgi:hypothetical protein
MVYGESEGLGGWDLHLVSCIYFAIAIAGRLIYPAENRWRLRSRNPGLSGFAGGLPGILRSTRESG